MDIAAVLKQLRTTSKGLSGEEVAIRLHHFGPNELPDKQKQRWFVALLRQFHSFLIYLLLLAAAISFFLHNNIDAYLILAIVLINAIIGFAQEYRAEHSIEALKRMIAPKTTVIRNAELIQVYTKQVVPGDILFLQEGEQVPGDARVLESGNLRAMEASLTGESFPVGKYADTLPANVAMADQKNMLWKGTFIVGGEGMAVVVATGEQTRIGQVALSLEEIQQQSGHLESRVNKLAVQLGIIASAGAILTFLIGYFVRGFEFSEVFLFTIASLVAGIPEGLLAVIAIVLAIGAHRMAGQNAIVRKLSATETLGHATVIATDKTGTLTQNTMNVEQVILPDGTSFSVSGKGWETAGNFYQDTTIVQPLEHIGLKKLLHLAAVCNNARVLREEGENQYSIIGDPTEAAMVVLARKAGLSRQMLEPEEKRLRDYPFDKTVRYRASLVEITGREKRKELYLFGAPETLLDKSISVLVKGEIVKLNKSQKQTINKQIDRITKAGMRVLALGYQPMEDTPERMEDGAIDGLIFVGIVGMKDPPRPEIKKSLERARQAGIRVIMKTGDHKETAVAIAREIGLLVPTSNAKYPQAITGLELEAMNESEFKAAINNVSVFARLTPEMKLKIATVLQEQGEIVAMTGDGVNDAPALKKADIGIAMGITGTDVARASSEMVLSDDNFASIIEAIKEGRIVFRNIRQVTYFLLTTNLAEDVTILVALLLGFSLPLLPVQLLWLNLITDGLVVLALAAEPQHYDILRSHPQKDNIDILVKDIIPFFLILVAVMTLSTLFIFNAYLPEGVEKARTGAFAVLAFSQLFNVLNMRSMKDSVFTIGLFSNPYVLYAILISALLLPILFYVPFISTLFSFVPLSGIELLHVILLSSVVFWLGEGYKFIRNQFSIHRGDV